MKTEPPEDLKMMNEWAESLIQRLPTVDPEHAKIALEWFYNFACSKIQKEEKQRLITQKGEGS